MDAQKLKDGHEDLSGPVAGMVAKLLPVIARKKAADKIPVRAGSSFFYEVEKGWETDILRRDDSVVIAGNTLELEAAFDKPEVRTVLICADASITKEVALRICARHGRGKTIFYEVG